MVLAPGTILQRIYLKERLKTIKPGTFIEVGTGIGMLSQLLCSYGWQGIGYDLNKSSIEKNRKRNQTYIDLKKYDTRNEDWLSAKPEQPVDLIISSMVLEHLNPAEEKMYFEKCKSWLNQNGRAIILVPSSMKHWGIEDEIAGHFRRYTFQDLKTLAKELDWSVIKMSGLTYPISNLLNPVSDWLVRRSESNKLKLNMKERTKQSGNRNVLFKTKFPSVFKLLLNEIVLYPLHLLQKLFSNNPNCLIIYFECSPKAYCVQINSEPK